MITDHSDLTELTKSKCFLSRMVRWSLNLAEYNLDVESGVGKENAVADLLSRNP